MITIEEAHKAFDKYGSARAAARALGVHHSTITKRLRKDAMGKKQKALQSTGKSKADFRDLYDKDYIVPKKISDGLKELGKSWEYEMEFIKQIGVSVSDISKYREMFSDHVIVIKRDNKKVWVGDKSLASELREMI